MSERMKHFWQDHRRVVVICLLATLAWGMAAHAYQFLNFQYSHDSLDGLYAIGQNNIHKIELGRVLAPAYRAVVRGSFAVPWMQGVLGLLWITLGAFVIADLFDIRKTWLLVLLCGILAVNQTVIAQSATYLDELDQNMFGMFTACLGAWFWAKKPKGWFLWGVIALTVSLGMYQSYISVAIGLVMIALLLRLMQGEKASAALRDGVLAAVMVIVSGVLFLLCAKAITSATEIPLAQRNNSLAALGTFSLANLPALIADLYQDFWKSFIEQPNTWLTPGASTALNWAVVILVGIMLVRALLRRDLGIGQKILIALIAVLLPLGLNICHVLTSGGVSHTLMKYACVLMYVLCLLLASQWEKAEPKPGRFARRLSAVIACVLLFSFVQTANTAYFKKTSVDRATYSRMTNVMYDMIYYGYIPGETPLVVEGSIPLGPFPGYEAVGGLVGMGFENAVGWDHVAKKHYFSYVLGDNANFLPDDEWAAILEDELVQSMPCYPEPGYIEMIDDVLVVKLS